MRVLGESFKMNAGYLSIGYTGTDMGGAFFLPKIVGYARACEILMNPERLVLRSFMSGVSPTKWWPMTTWWRRPWPLLSACATPPLPSVCA